MSARTLLLALLAGTTAARASGLLTWNNGDTLNAKDLNANFSTLQDEITALQNRLHPVSAFRATLSNPVSVPNGVQTLGTFDHVEYDVGTEYSVQSATFTPAQSGIYVVSCEIYGFPPAPDAGFATGVFSATLYKNGFPTDANQLDADDVQVTSNLTTVSSRAVALVSLAAKDTLNCSFYQSTGAPVTVSSWQGRSSFSAARID